MPQTEEIKKVHVRIISEIDGEKSISGSRGELERGMLFANLYYPVGEDRVTLRVTGQEIVMEREGSCYLRLSFRPGRISEGLIGHSKTSFGEVKIDTSTALCEWAADGIRITLKYALLFGEERQETSLRLIAKTEKSEENI